MKRLLGTIAIVLCAMAGVLAAPQRRIEATHTPRCTLATLNGRYLFGGIATLVPPASGGQALLAVAGYHVFNGDGTGKDFVAASIDGQTFSGSFRTRTGACSTSLTRSTPIVGAHTPSSAMAHRLACSWRPTVKR